MSADDAFTISRLIVYPIKSCKGIDLDSSACTPDGLLYDRQWMIVDGVSFKALTARQCPQMVLIEPSLVPADNALRVLLPPIGQRTTVSGAWTWPIPLRAVFELKRRGFELPLELGETERKEWERLSVDLWGLSLTGLSPPPTHRANQVLSHFLGRPVRIVAKDPEGRRAPGKKAGEAGAMGDGAVTTAFADTYALHLVTLPTLVSFSVAIARSDQPSELRPNRPVKGEPGSSTANPHPPPVEAYRNPDPLSSTSPKQSSWSSMDWSTIFVYDKALPAPSVAAEPRIFDRSPEALIDRFRPNVVLTPTPSRHPTPPDGKRPLEQAYPEDNWGALEVGDRTDKKDGERWDMHVVGRCGRCTLPNVDPVTGARHPTLPHKVLVAARPKEVDEYVGVPCPTLGVYAVPVRRTTGDGSTATRSARWALGDRVVVRSRRVNVDAEKDS